MFRVNTNNIVVTHFWVPIKKKRRSLKWCRFERHYSSFSLGCAAGEEGFWICFFTRSLSLSLSLFPQLDQTLTSNTSPPHALQSRWREERKPCLQRTPHATLPYAMTGQDRVTPLPLLINMGRYRRIGGSGKKKEKKNEGTEERVFEKRERFWKKQRWMNWGFGGEKAKKNRG